MSKKEIKTNAMRILDRMKISYTYETYECDEFTDGIQVADKLNLDHRQVFKTLVTTGKTGSHYVFVIPIEDEIDFKKAATKGILGCEIKSIILPLLSDHVLREANHYLRILEAYEE